MPERLPPPVNFGEEARDDWAPEAAHILPDTQTRHTLVVIAPSQPPALSLWWRWKGRCGTVENRYYGREDVYETKTFRCQNSDNRLYLWHDRNLRNQVMSNCGMWRIEIRSCQQGCIPTEPNLVTSNHRPDSHTDGCRYFGT
jgi:hypothetical protein